MNSPAPSPAPQIVVHGRTAFTDEQFQQLIAAFTYATHYMGGGGAQPGPVEFLGMAVRDHLAPGLSEIAEAIGRVADALEALRPPSTPN